MKLSLESHVIAKKIGEFEGCRMIKEAGFDCVDMSYYWLAEDSMLLSDGYREYAIKLKEYLDTIGLECNQAHAPFDVKYGEDFSVLSPHYLSVIRSLESASILGAKTIVVHSIENGLLFDREYNLNYYKSLEPFCEKFKIRIAVENLYISDKKRQRYDGNFKSPIDFCNFIRELDSPWFVGCVDLGHAAMTAGEPEDYILNMDSNLLQALHVQDGNYRVDSHTIPYLGQFDWNKIMQSLKKINYNGDLTFEIFGFLGHFPKNIIPSGLSFAEKIGRHLISVYEEATL